MPVPELFRSLHPLPFFPPPPLRRSTDMDKWTAEQLKTMTVGGNDNARQFFKDKGWDDLTSAKVREERERGEGEERGGEGDGG